jgi:hypothetical protein
MSITKTDMGAGTSISREYPWGTTVTARALCSDGKLRTCYNIQEADTFFSIPCNVEVHGKPIKGYITFNTRDGFSTHTDDDPMQVEFRHYTYSDNWGLLPKWPTRGE